MYVTIDKTNCKFLRKHPDVFMLANLAYIESPHIDVSIQPCNHHTFLQECTDLELKLLYKNTTGVDQIYYGDQLRIVLAELVSRMPLFEGDKWELEYQANTIPEGNNQPYTYVKGSYKPTIVQDLFQPSELPKSETEASIALMGKHKIKSFYPEDYSDKIAPTSSLSTVSNTSVPPQPIKRPVPPKNATTPPQKRGTVRTLIWDIADKEWESRGKPMDVKQVLQMRKELYDVLFNDHGIGKNTSSNELGAWQKNKQIF